MVTYCGQAIDGYGWPYQSDADVILRSETNELTRYSIDGQISPGINFMLYLNLDDNRTTNRYASGTVVTGMPINIIIRDTYGQKTIMESNAVPAISDPGTVTLINITAGTDSDGDGLPDLWEQELVDFSAGAYTNITDVHPEDDFDGDGFSNGEEYYCGTFAFLDYDYFYIDRIGNQENGRFKVDFITVPGKTYQLQTCTNLIAESWSTCPYSPTADGALTTDAAIGNGNRIYMYIPFSTGSHMMRVLVQ